MSREEEIRARVEAASPGEWWWNSYSGVFSGCADDDNVELICEVLDVPNANGHSGDELITRAGRGNAEFIAHAREDVPWLLGEVERLREALGWYGERARSLGRYVSDNRSYEHHIAIEAVVVELLTDGGKRAALAEEDRE